MPIDPHFAKGDLVPSIRWLRDFARRVRASAVSAIAPLYTREVMGGTGLELREAPEFVGVVSSVNGWGYTVLEAAFNVASKSFVPIAGGRSVIAYEYNLSPGVAIGTAVTVRYTPADDWRFFLPRAGSVAATIPGCRWLGVGLTSIDGTLTIADPRPLSSGYSTLCETVTCTKTQNNYPYGIETFTLSWTNLLGTCPLGQTYSFTMVNTAAPAGLSLPLGTFWADLGPAIEHERRYDATVRGAPGTPITTITTGTLYAWITCSANLKTRFNWGIVPVLSGTSPAGASIFAGGGDLSSTDPLVLSGSVGGYISGTYRQYFFNPSSGATECEGSNIIIPFSAVATLTV